MEINELRIGNYLYLCGWNVKVFGVREDGVYVANDLNTIFKTDITDIRPIPLTKDFFDKLGFVPDTIAGDVGLIVNDNLRMTASEHIKGWHIHIDDEDCMTCYSRLLKYVHELQNAYYVATGEELDIDL